MGKKLNVFKDSKKFKDLRKYMNDKFTKILHVIKGNNDSKTHADSEAPLHQHDDEIHRTIEENLHANLSIQIDHDIVRFENESIVTSIHFPISDVVINKKNLSGDTLRTLTEEIQ